MARGTIARIIGSFGFITPDEGGEDIYFRVDWVGDVSPSGVHEGLRVEYETRRTEKGLQTSQVRAIGGAAIGARKRTGEYRFLNPYNFVRYLTKPRPQNHVLGDCSPPPHDRYVGLTGRITCSVEAVTPLFISDSHAIQVEKVKDEKGNKKDHPSYRFFQYDGKSAIPATSLRGVIRSVYEAVTNSCFAVLGGERLSYRLEPGVASTLVPARVEQDPHGEWRLRLLTGFTPLNPGRRPKGLYAASVNLYDPIEQPRGHGRRSRPPRKVSLRGLKHSEECYALVEKKGIFTYVQELGSSPSSLSRPSRPSQAIVQGWLCINNQNIENKRKERFFFRDSRNTVGPTFVKFDDKVVQAYRDLIKDYQLRHREEARERRKPDQIVKMGKDTKPALSRYMYQKEDLTLKEGTLVYTRLSRTSGGIGVDFIAPAAIPRVSYEYSIRDLLHNYPHLCLCEEYERLCPACRLFGWVYGGEEKLEPETRTAYAGRLRFSHATLIEDKGVIDDVTLAVLSSPKPTTTRFYLRPKRGKPQSGLDDAQAGYDGSNVLRGRKFYRHHGKADPVEYKRTAVAGWSGKDDQNRTLVGVRKPSNQFQFAIEFHNLTPEELGGLLWALELREGKQQGHHRLGLAKPLGLGSVKVNVTGLETLDLGLRYSSLEPAGGWQSNLGQKETWVNVFRQKVEQVYSKPLETLANIKDLLALLGESPNLPIHYPRVDPEPSPEGKNFEWFVGNKRSGRKPGPRVALPLAEDDTEGLPLIDRHGKARRN